MLRKLPLPVPITRCCFPAKLVASIWNHYIDITNIPGSGLICLCYAEPRNIKVRSVGNGEGEKKKSYVGTFERMSAPLSATVTHCPHSSLHCRTWRIEEVTRSERQKLTQAVT